MGLFVSMVVLIILVVWNALEWDPGEWIATYIYLLFGLIVLAFIT